MRTRVEVKERKGSGNVGEDACNWTLPRIPSAKEELSGGAAQGSGPFLVTEHCIHSMIHATFLI